VTSNNVRRLHAVIDSINRDGFDALLDELHPDIEFADLPQAPEEKVKRGPERVQNWYRDMAEIWEEMRLEVEDVTELDSERLMATLRIRARAKRSGIEVDQKVVNLFTLKDDKLYRLQAFSDMESALEAAGAKGDGK
jgi:ketosteroid isomerase-like protein